MSVPPSLALLTVPIVVPLIWVVTVIEELLQPASMALVTMKAWLPSVLLNPVILKVLDPVAQLPVVSEEDT